jgi:hypothetical protein
MPLKRQDAKLERHVESRKSCSTVWFCPRDVMNGKLRVGNQTTDLLETHFATVGYFLGAPWNKSTIEDGEQNSVFEFPVLLIERAIQKDVVGVLGHETIKRPCVPPPLPFPSKREPQLV